MDNSDTVTGEKREAFSTNTDGVVDVNRESRGPGMLVELYWWSMILVQICGHLRKLPGF